MAMITGGYRGYIPIYSWLVVEPYPSEKYENQLGLLFPTEWKNKKCSKPPTR
jgi:hypothetical protein